MTTTTRTSKTGVKGPGETLFVASGGHTAKLRGIRSPFDSKRLSPEKAETLVNQARSKIVSTREEIEKLPWPKAEEKAGKAVDSVEAMLELNPAMGLRLINQMHEKVKWANLKEVQDYEDGHMVSLASIVISEAERVETKASVEQMRNLIGKFDSALEKIRGLTELYPDTALRLVAQLHGKDLAGKIANVERGLEQWYPRETKK